MLRRFIHDNPVSVLAGLLAAILSVIMVVVLWTLPEGKPTAPPNALVASSSAQSKSLTATDFPLGNYSAGALPNHTNACALLPLPDLVAATHQSSLGITQRTVPANSATNPTTSCTYGKDAFSVEVSTEKLSSFAIFNNDASIFTHTSALVNHIYAISPEQLKPLGIRYGVWLMHDGTYIGAVFRTPTRVINGVPTEANVTFWCPGSVAKSSLDGLIRTAVSFGK